MILMLHILAALTSLAFSGYTYIAPSKRKLRISYGLIVATFISGTYLVILTNSPLLAACTSGLIYLSVTLTGTVAAQRKLPADE